MNTQKEGSSSNDILMSFTILICSFYNDVGRDYGQDGHYFRCQIITLLLFVGVPF